MSKKSILEIQVAVKEGDPSLTNEELRLCVECLSNMEHFYRTDLIAIIDAIRNDANAPVLKLKAELARGTIERMFAAHKKAPDEWLGPNNIPGTSEFKKRLEAGKRLFERATGEKL